MNSQILKLNHYWQNSLNQIAKDYFQNKADFKFTVHLISKKAIRILNRNHRQKDYPTAVLSFPLRQQIFGQKSCRNEKQDLGDIFICKEVANKEGHRVENLIIHGFLHLIGLTHENLPQEKKWTKIEKGIFKKLSLKNGFKKIF